MAYKALGWTVWKAAKLYLRHRYGGIVTRRRALVAAGALAAVAAVAVAGRGAARD